MIGSDSSSCSTLPPVSAPIQFESCWALHTINVISVCGNYIMQLWFMRDWLLIWWRELPVSLARAFIHLPLTQHGVSEIFSQADKRCEQRTWRKVFLIQFSLFTSFDLLVKLFLIKPTNINKTLMLHFSIVMLLAILLKWRPANDTQLLSCYL